MKREKIIIYLIIISTLSYGQSWLSIYSGTNHQVRQMFSDSIENYLYISGRFTKTGGVYTKGIARWDGTRWDSLGAGIDGLDTVNSSPGGLAFGMARYNNKLFVCGDFTTLGHTVAKQIGIWDGNSWDSLSIQPNVLYGAPDNLFVLNNELYVSGQFDSIGGIAANSIAKWNGVIWASLNFPNYYPSVSHFYSSIVSICEYHGKLYVGGRFHSSPVDTVGQILCFDGTNWQTVSGGIKGLNAGVGSMIVYHNELYVAGAFYKSDGNSGNHIQKWNDTTWTDVGGGTGYINPFIYDLLVYQDKLYAVGVFDEAGGIPAQKIAVWDGVKWCGLGGEFDNNIGCISSFHDSIFIGGGFWTINGDSMNYISKWNGGSYTDTCSIGINSITDYELTKFVNTFPNPAKDYLKIVSNYIMIDFITLKDILNRTIFSARINNSYFSLDVELLKPGVYFLILETKEGNTSKKFIKEY